MRVGISPQVQCVARAGSRPSPWRRLQRRDRSGAQHCLIVATLRAAGKRSCARSGSWPGRARTGVALFGYRPRAPGGHEPADVPAAALPSQEARTGEDASQCVRLASCEAAAGDHQGGKMVVWSMPGRLQLGRVVFAESFGERHHERDAHRREMGGADTRAGMGGREISISELSSAGASRRSSMVQRARLLYRRAERQRRDDLAGQRPAGRLTEPSPLGGRRSPPATPRSAPRLRQVIARESMMDKIITVFTEEAPKPLGHYSQAVRGGGLIHISGQLPITSGGVPDNQTASFEAEAISCLKTFWLYLVKLAANLSMFRHSSKHSVTISHAVLWCGYRSCTTAT